MRMSREEFIDIIENSEILDKFENFDYAQNFYAAFCNVDWAYEVTNTEIKEVSFSWRTIADIVAELRDSGESHIDFYCSGMICDVNADEAAFLSPIPQEYFVSEGVVTDEVMADLNAVGFFVVSADNEEDETPMINEDFDDIQLSMSQSDDDDFEE